MPIRKKMKVKPLRRKIQMMRDGRRKGADAGIRQMILGGGSKEANVEVVTTIEAPRKPVTLKTMDIDVVAVITIEVARARTRTVETAIVATETIEIRDRLPKEEKGTERPRAKAARETREIRMVMRRKRSHHSRELLTGAA